MTINKAEPLLVTISVTENECNQIAEGYDLLAEAELSKGADANVTMRNKFIHQRDRYKGRADMLKQRREGYDKISSSYRKGERLHTIYSDTGEVAVS